MKKFNTLTVTCVTNPDWNGLWERKEVEQDMHDLSCTGGAWEFVLNHVFDDNTLFSPPGYDMLYEAIENGTVCSITLMLGENKVEIEQS